MRYLDAIKLLPFIVVFFIGLYLLLPLFALDINIELIITVSTFLFAILAGFFISRLNYRYDKIRELVSLEDASLLSFYNASKIYGQKFSEEIREIIDKYYIICYENPVSGAYKKTLPQVLKIWDRLKDISKYRSESAYQVLCGSLIDLEKSRKESSAIYSEKISIGQWLILSSLAIIIIIGLVIIRTGSITLNIFVILLSSAIILVLLIIRDLNNCMLGGSPLMEESGQEVLEAIGKERYYHERFLKKGMSLANKDKQIKKYRLGTHKIGSEKRNIKIIEK